MVLSNVIDDVTIPRHAFVFGQSRAWVSAGFTNVRSLEVAAFDLVYCSLSVWRWLPHRLSKRQSLSTTTVLFRTTFTRTIKLNLLNQLMWYTSLWLWGWSPHRLSKRQALSTTTVLFRTMFIRTIILNLWNDSKVQTFQSNVIVMPWFKNWWLKSYDWLPLWWWRKQVFLPFSWRWVPDMKFSTPNLDLTHPWPCAAHLELVRCLGVLFCSVIPVGLIIFSKL